MVVLLSLYVLFWPSPAGSGVQVPGADKAVHAGLFLLLAVTAALRFGTAPGVLVVVLAGLVVVAEFVLRGVVDRIIAQQVEQSLPDGTTGQVDAPSLSGATGSAEAPARAVMRSGM